MMEGHLAKAQSLLYEFMDNAFLVIMLAVLFWRSGIIVTFAAGLAICWALKFVVWMAMKKWMLN